MRGSPLLRAAIAFFIILSLGYPLSRMTRAGDQPPVAEPQHAESAAKSVHLQLTFTLPAQNLKVLSLGKEIWSELSPGMEVEKDLSIPYPAEGVDLRFEIDWPADAPTAALRVKLTDPAGNDHEKSVWSKGPADEVLTFP